MGRLCTIQALLSERGQRDLENPKKMARVARYHRRVIESFCCRDTGRLYARHCVAKLEAIERIARRRLDALDSATMLLDLRSPPGNRLEALKGDRIGQQSIRVNDHWRICFRWREEDAAAEDVEIVDYH